MLDAHLQFSQLIRYVRYHLKMHVLTGVGRVLHFLNCSLYPHNTGQDVPNVLFSAARHHWVVVAARRKLPAMGQAPKIGQMQCECTFAHKNSRAVLTGVVPGVRMKCLSSSYK